MITNTLGGEVGILIYNPWEGFIFMATLSPTPELGNCHIPVLHKDILPVSLIFGSSPQASLL